MHYTTYTSNVSYIICFKLLHKNNKIREYPNERAVYR